jgi:hypothetical protein
VYPCKNAVRLRFVIKYSKAPMSGALPINGIPTFTPASMNLLPAFSLKNPLSGRFPFAWRGAVASEVSILTKSAATGVKLGQLLFDKVALTMLTLPV